MKKKFLFAFFMASFLSGVGQVLGMDPVVQKIELRPVDKIFLAACKNNKSIDQLIALGANPQSIDPENGYTGLHYACMNGSEEKMRYFLKRVFQVKILAGGNFRLDLPGAIDDDLISFTRKFGHEKMVQALLGDMLLNASRLKMAPKLFQETATALLSRGACINAVDLYTQLTDFIGCTPLHYACFLGDIDRVKFLVAKGADINCISQSVSTPLYTLFLGVVKDEYECIRYDIAEFLISCGAKATVKGVKNKTLLQIVVGRGDIKSVKMLLQLLKNSAELNVVDDNGQNALFQAVLFEKIDLIPVLFDAGVIPIIDNKGFSCMHHAALKGNVDIIKELIARGLDVNALDNQGQNPLHHACQGNHFEVVKTLVAAGAHVLQQDFQWNTPLQLCRDEKIQKFLIKKQRSAFAPHKNKAVEQLVVLSKIDREFIDLCESSMAFKEFEVRATALLEQGANVNAQVIGNPLEDDEFRGFTPLLYACSDSEVERVKFLVRNGAQVNYKTPLGVFPLYVLFSGCVGNENESKRFELMKYLIANGADISLIGPDGHSLFAIMVVSNSKRCVKFALDNKFDVNVVDDYGRNALYEAVRYDAAALMTLLFDAGVKPLIDYEGFSLLHVAAVRNNVIAAQELIRRGLNVNHANNYGKTPLHYAAEYAEVEMIKFLLKAGAEFNVIDQNGKTPVQLSENNESKTVLSYMRKIQKEMQLKKNPQKLKTAFLMQQAPKVQDKKEVIQKKEPQKKTTKKKNKKKKTKKTLQKLEKVVEQEQLVSPAIEFTHGTDEQATLETEVSVNKVDEKTATNDVLVVDDVPHITIKPAKKSLLDRVQEKVVDTLIPSNTKKTFAQVLVLSQNKPQEQRPRIDSFDDDHLRIAFQQSRLLTSSGCQLNPLMNVSYSSHVCEKKNDPCDLFHNFSSHVEEQLGLFAREEVLEKPTKYHSAKIKYSIPASVGMLGSPKTIPGTFEFIIKDQQMRHRFFKPDKSVHKKSSKKDVPLLLSSSLQNNSQELRK